MLQAENLSTEFDSLYHRQNPFFSECNVYFQPIFSSKTAKTYGYEALPKISKKIHYLRNLLLDSGKEGSLFLIDLLFKRNVFKEATKQKISDYLFIHICPENSYSPEAQLAIIEKLAEAFSFSKGKIVLEITEKYIRKNYEALIKAFNKYRKRGFKIAINDFGSSLDDSKLLSLLEPDFVKIDEHFTESLNENIFSRSFVEFTVSICKRHGILVIAEGIKTICQLTELLKLEVDLIQGPYLSMPQFEMAS